MDQSAPRVIELPEEVMVPTPAVWENARRVPADVAFASTELDRSLCVRADANWRTYAPLLAQLFPEIAPTGRIDSPLEAVDAALARELTGNERHTVLVKSDHLLPITGTIKARGGIYEVIQHAVSIAEASGLLKKDEPIETLVSAEARALFSRYEILTGSTGNLGYSIGISATALGFKVEVHMSADAKPWKKDRLRALGVSVVEHSGDFGAAVEAARGAAARRDDCYVIDDENSVPLFEGYSAAALDLKAQLDAAGIEIGPARRLIAYLPCGVGGSPGGVTFGLKHLFGDNVDCVFVEPVSAPAMLLQLAVGTDAPISVYDVGLSNDTIADGLAVAAASMLVARNVVGLVDAVVTVEDQRMLEWARRMWRDAGMRLEPSAAAAFEGLRSYMADSAGAPPRNADAVHIVWTTGGSQLPDAEFNANLKAAEGGNGDAD